MRKVADFLIIATVLSIGAQYALDGLLWLVIACGFVGLFWLLQSHHRAELGLNFSFLFLAVLNIAGAFLDHHPVWILTNMVLLLVAWNLDHFDRDLQKYVGNGQKEYHINDLFPARFQRLSIVMGLGWGLGMLALNLRISVGFFGAVILAFVVVISLGQIARLLWGGDRKKGSSKSPDS